MASVMCFVILASAMLLSMAITAFGHYDSSKARDVFGEENVVSFRNSYQQHPSYFSYPQFGGARHRKRSLSCIRNTSACAAKHSKGPSCCFGRCTNTRTDKYNCGKCGYRCRSGKTCCNGKCVSTDTDAFNCGTCNQACLTSEYCFRGLCNYSGL